MEYFNSAKRSFVVLSNLSTLTLVLSGCIAGDQQQFFSSSGTSTAPTTNGATSSTNASSTNADGSSTSSTTLSTSSATATPTPTPGCGATAFGNVCNGPTPNTTPADGTQTTSISTDNTAHGFFYNLNPIPDRSGFTANVGAYKGQPTAASMSLLNAQSVIPNLNLYTPSIHVPLQSWTQGFPGHPSLQEWFGVCYDAAWTAPVTGSYTFVTAVDDAIALIIDGNWIGENDDGNVNQSMLVENTGAHYTPKAVAFAPVTLVQGTHTVQIMYYQSWPVQLEAQVWALRPGNTFTPGTTPTDADLMPLTGPIDGALNCPH